MSESLDDFLDDGPELDVEVETQAPPHERWTVTDRGRADWALRKLIVLRQQTAARQAEADAYRAKVGVWLADVLAPLERSEAYFEAMLKEYGEATYRADPKALPIKLPNGRIRHFTGRRSVVITDEGAFIAFALESHRDWLKIEARKSAIKVGTTEKEPCEDRSWLVDENGEVVDGVESQQGEGSFKVEVDDGDGDG